MSNPANNDPIITLKIRNDIWDVEQISLSKVVRILRLCTPCIGSTLANNPGYKHNVLYRQPSIGVCEKCGSLTYSMAMEYLGLNALELNQVILLKRIHTVPSRGISYRVERVKYSV